MIIDSRSFLEFNTSHIAESVNVSSSKLIRRRLQQNKVGYCFADNCCCSHYCIVSLGHCVTQELPRRISVNRWEVVRANLIQPLASLVTRQTFPSIVAFFVGKLFKRDVDLVLKLLMSQCVIPKPGYNTRKTVACSDD